MPNPRAFQIRVWNVMQCSWTAIGLSRKSYDFAQTYHDWHSHIIIYEMDNNIFQSEVYNYENRFWSSADQNCCTITKSIFSFYLFLFINYSWEVQSWWCLSVLCTDSCTFISEPWLLTMSGTGWWWAALSNIRWGKYLIWNNVHYYVWPFI